MIDLIIPAKISDLGNGFKVRRALPTIQRRMVGPFIFFDHMGPVDFEIGNGMDVRPHPHIGLSTLTYLFEGEIIHRDTLGVEQAIRPGAVNWMTAGSGVAHSERSSQEARSVQQRIHGIQIWIALPREKEELSPSFFHHSEKEIPEISHQGSGVRVIAGDFEKVKSPVEVHSPLTYLDIRLPQGKHFDFQRDEHDLALYCAVGSLKVGESVLQEGALATVQKGKNIRVMALTDSRFLLLGGEAFPESRHIWWNFVSSSKERIEKAKKDWTEKNFGQIKGEHEFIPLPT